jgi:hypothetical protein
MTEPTMDEKIQQLVRSVLEAVDARLAGIRAEATAAANDMQHRHQQLHGAVVALQQRVDLLASQRTVGPDEVESLRASITELRAHLAAGPPQPSLSPAPHMPPPIFVVAPPEADAEPEPAADYSGVTRPIMDDVHVTSQVPIVPMVQRVTPEWVDDSPAADATSHDVDIPAITWAEERADEQQETEMIDLERLARLLSDKLEHLNLPTPE